MFNLGPNGPCYRCLYPTPPPPGAVGSCAELGVLGIVAGMIGNLQALETIKIILGREGEAMSSCRSSLNLKMIAYLRPEPVLAPFSCTWVSSVSQHKDAIEEAQLPSMQQPIRESEKHQQHQLCSVLRGACARLGYARVSERAQSSPRKCQGSNILPPLEMRRSEAI